MKFQNASVCVFDEGTHVELARKLARDFGTVFYFCPWTQGGFPDQDDFEVGTGVEGVIRASDPFDLIPMVDLWIFTDVNNAGFQKHLRSLGKKVWGLGPAEEFELNRWMCRQWQKDVGLPFNSTTRLVGIDSLRRFLEKQQEPGFIKISRFRGAMETFKHTDYQISEIFLDKIERDLGPLKHEQEFLFETMIPGVEFGIDNVSVRGDYPKTSLWGVEVKDAGYLGKVSPLKDIPLPLRLVSVKLAEHLRECSGNISTEVRVGPDRKGYLIDLTCRFPSPPFDGWADMIDNLAEIFWYGAAGVLIEPVWNTKYLALAIMESDWATHSYLPITFDPKDRDSIKLHNLTQKGDKYYISPHQAGMEIVGHVVGTSNISLQHAIQKVQKVAESIKAPQLRIHCESLDEGLETISEAKKYGINF